MLISNTERLIEQFEAERALLEVQQKAKKSREEPRFKAKATMMDRRSGFTPEERASVEPEALRNLTQKLPGLNFYSAGFNGLLQSEIDRILREKAKQTQ